MEKYHVCLVSDQPIPNLIPALLEQPSGVILLTSREMKERAAWLRLVLERKGIRVGECEIDAYDFTSVASSCEKLIRQAGSARTLELNVTCGTKIAALAGFHVFSNAGKRIFYQNTANSQLLELGPALSNKPIHGNHISVFDYLTAYGFSLMTEGGPTVGFEKRQPYLKALGRVLLHNNTLLGRLNATVERYGRKTSASFPLKELGAGGDELINLFVQCGVVSRSDTEVVTMPAEQNVFFCKGGWLEEYVFQAVFDLELDGLKPLINTNVVGKRHHLIENEFDVLFTYTDRLFIISCKTGRLDREMQGLPTKGKEALYELDSLSADAGGLFGRAMLVSARPVRPVDRNRAKEMDIALVEGTEVLEFEQKLRDWLR